MRTDTKGGTRSSGEQGQGGGLSTQAMAVRVTSARSLGNKALWFCPL